jgi:ferredoxin-thioredoxin reductase catalytic chain
VNPEGLPITEYLPEDHEGRQVYGLVKDPHPEKGRALRHKAGTGEAVADEVAEE